MQIKGNFDLTVISLEVIIPTTLREIDWPMISYNKASFSLFLVMCDCLNELVKHATENKDIGSWEIRSKMKEMNETFNEHYI